MMKEYKLFWVKTLSMLNKDRLYRLKVLSIIKQIKLYQSKDFQYAQKKTSCIIKWAFWRETYAEHLLKYVFENA